MSGVFVECAPRILRYILYKWEFLIKNRFFAQKVLTNYEQIVNITMYTYKNVNKLLTK